VAVPLLLKYNVVEGDIYKSLWREDHAPPNGTLLWIASLKATGGNRPGCRILGYQLGF
jgi:hypothetical protein